MKSKDDLSLSDKDRKDMFDQAVAIRKNRALIASIQSADSLLINQRATVNLRHGHGWAASSSGATINLKHPPKFSPSNPEDLKTLLGLNYHELLHVWFTPLMSNSAWNREQRAGYNILEDLRIENLGVALYPSIKGFLTHTFGVMCMDEQTDNTTQAAVMLFVLTYGRKYLPRKVRDEVTRMVHGYVTKDIVKALMEIVDRYIVLNPMRERSTWSSKVIALINQLVNILKSVSVDLDAPPPGAGVNHGNGDLASSTGGNRDGNTIQQQQAQEALAEVLQEADADDDAGGDADDDADGDSAGAAGEGGADGGDSGSDAADDESDGPTRGAKGGRGAGGADNTPDPDQFGSSVTDAALEAMDAIEEATKLDTRMNTEVAQHRAAVLAGPKMLRTKSSWNQQLVTKEMRDSSRDFAERMRRLTADDIASGWDQFHSSGRINVQRAMRSDGYDNDLFDRWDPGHQDDFLINAFFAADASGSMGSELSKVCKALWIMRTAIESLDGTVRTCLWSDKAPRYLYPDGKINTNRYAVAGTDGGTNPNLMLTEAAEWLVGQNPASNRVLFILTDGEWSGRATADDLIEFARSRGCLVVIVGYRYDINKRSGYGGTMGAIPADLIVQVHDASSVVNVAEQLTASIFQDRLNKIRG